MKKILSILASLGIAATASSAVVACGDSNDRNVVLSPCEISDIKVSEMSDDNTVDVSFKVSQFINSSYTNNDIKRFSVVNDENPTDQKTVDSDDNNLKDVKIIGDVNIKSNLDKVQKQDKKSIYVDFDVTFKVKIESISEHHVFEWIEYSKTNNQEYSVIRTFQVNLPGVKPNN